MNELQELLATRATQSDPMVLQALREGLARDAGQSGPAAPLHRLLQAYFALDEAASKSSFMRALRRHGDTAQALLAMLAEDGEDTVAGLMRSLMDGRPAPTGALAAGLRGEGAAQAQAAGGGVKAGFDAFAQAALRSKASSAEMELSLAWGAVEGGLLDRVERQAEALAFAHGPTHRAALARARLLDEQVAQHGIADLLQALLAAERPRMLACPSEWDVGQEGAPAARVEIPVSHAARHTAPTHARRLAGNPAARLLIELYEVVNGAELFIPQQHEPAEPGLTLIGDDQWDAERAHVMTWLTLGGDDDLPDWAHSLVPIAALPGDASRWVVPLEGPLAGSVLLSNDDVPEQNARYPSVAHFVAALRVRPQEVLSNGGYVSYAVPEHAFLLYPEGYAEGLTDGGAASTKASP
jgi:hypothetical protein